MGGGGVRQKLLWYNMAYRSALYTGAAHVRKNMKRGGGLNPKRGGRWILRDGRGNTLRVIWNKFSQAPPGDKHICSRLFKRVFKEIKFKNIPNGIAVENSDPVGFAKFRQIRIKT